MGVSLHGIAEDLVIFKSSHQAVGQVFMLIKPVNAVMMLNTGTYERQIKDSLVFHRVLVLGPAKGSLTSLV